MRTRLLFALLGALACMVASLVAEAVFGAARLSQSLDDRTGRVLIFRSDIARRLENAGGKTGDIEIALAWNNTNDLDLSVVDPHGELIFYGHKMSLSGGELDVDANFVKPYTNEPVENVYWPIGRAPNGHYIVRVTYFENHGGPERTTFRCVVLERGRLHPFTGTVGPEDIKQTRVVYQFDTGGAGQFWSGLAPSLMHAVLLTGFWCTLLATLLALALAGGQQWLWLRRYGQRLVPVQILRRIVGWGALMGLAAGVGGQLLFSLFSAYFSLWPVIVGRSLGWGLLGAIVGWGLARRVPNLAARAAAVAGSLAGLLSASVFMAALGSGSDLLGRLLAAGLLGFLIGLLIRLDIEPDEETDVPYLRTERFTMEIMRMRPNRAGSAGSLRGHRAPRPPE